MPAVKDELADELGHIMAEENSPNRDISERDLEVFEQLFGAGGEAAFSAAEVVWVVGSLGRGQP